MTTLEFNACSVCVPFAVSGLENASEFLSFVYVGVDARDSPVLSLTPCVRLCGRWLFCVACDPKRVQVSPIKFVRVF